MALEAVFRTDGSPVIGSGHIMRCLTLADQLRRQSVNCRFVCRDFPNNLGPVIKGAGFEVHYLAHDASMPSENWLGATPETDVAQTISAIEDTPPDWLVVDHYEIHERWEDRLRSAFPDSRILVIDDLANRRHACDVLVDLSPDRKPSVYQELVSGDCAILTGLDYALLRPEFSAMRKRLGKPKQTPAEPPNILVTFGGGDTQMQMEATAQALGELSIKRDIAVTVIGSVEKLNRAFPQGSRLLDHSSEMAREMIDCDLMICAAGGTNWERCALGVPAVVMTVADNQIYNASAIEKLGIGVCVETSPEQIQNAVISILQETRFFQMAENCWQQCDARGAKRIASEMISQCVTMRPCQREDARFVYDARYSGDAERFYKNPAKPAYHDHVQWFGKALGSQDFSLFCAEIDGEKLAHVRLDHNHDEPDRIEVGIALAEHARGKGLAEPMLKAAIEYCRSKNIAAIDAEVHRDNAASRRLFENAGFIDKGEVDDVLLSYVFEIRP